MNDHPQFVTADYAAVLSCCTVVHVTAAVTDF